MNIVVLRGVLSSAPSVRELSSGSVLVSLELTTRDAEGQASSVPVAWFDPSAGCSFSSGDEVVVAGSVRRRFFRTAVGTQSRTEVVAIEVVDAGRRRDVTRVVKRVAAALPS